MKRVLILALVLMSQPGFAADNKASWPQWRGPEGTGMAPGGAPSEWSDTKNIKWKTDIPGRGHSTPVIWDDRIFLTTAVPIGQPPKPPAPQPADQQGREGRGRRGPGGGGPQVEHRFVVMCLDRRSGKVLWERTATVATPHEGYHPAYGSFASNSPITDGKYVYASFGSRGIYCYDMNGKPVWQKDLGIRMQMRLQFGEGAAPALHGDRLILLFDHEGESLIIALDKKTGKEVWRANRDERSSWSSPVIIDYNGRKQIVVSATSKVRTYDLDSGRLIWECAGLGANTIPAPIQNGDIVYVMSGFRNPKLLAIRLGKQGDLTGSDAILWSQTRGLSYTPSPVLHDNKLYVLTDSGMLSCFNATTGQPFYHQVRLPRADNFKASPIGAAGHLYLASESGAVYVVKMGEKMEIVATNTLDDEMFVSTPAVAAGELFLRGRNRLYCISSQTSRK